MTNKEINERIAKIKGFIPGPSTRIDWPNGVSLNKEKIPEGMFDICAENKNWAESISDAFELFQELPLNSVLLHRDEPLDPETFNVIKPIVPLWNVIINLPNDQVKKLTVHVNEDTPTRAICSSWLQWQEFMKGYEGNK